MPFTTSPPGGIEGIKTSHSNLSQGMYYLKASYANYFAAKYKTTGPLFQGRGQILS